MAGYFAFSSGDQNFESHHRVHMKRFQMGEDTVHFCLRVMVGVIILYDHVHPTGAFCKGSRIDVSCEFFVSKSCVDLLNFNIRTVNRVDRRLEHTSAILFTSLLTGDLLISTKVGKFPYLSPSEFMPVNCHSVMSIVHFFNYSLQTKCCFAV